MLGYKVESRGQLGDRDTVESQGQPGGLACIYHGGGVGVL